MEKPTILTERLEHKIYLIRATKVMLDSDFAKIYGVSTKVLNQATQKNTDRFPNDFMFQLTEEELQSLRSQFVTSKIGRGGRRNNPYAFTEHGVAMLSSVLKSPRAVQMNIFIIRAFIALRETIATIYSVVKQLINPPENPKKRMGFVDPDDT